MCKCRYCNKEINKDTAYSIKKGIYYCNESHYLSSLEKKKQKGSHSYKSAKGTDRRDYTDFIQNIYLENGFKKEFPNWQILMSQTNNILNNNPSWSYDTIKYVLWYQKEILGMRLITKESNYSPLSLVEYYAKEAENYWLECSEIAESIENFEFDDEPIVVKNKTSKRKQKAKQIDF